MTTHSLLRTNSHNIDKFDQWLHTLRKNFAVCVSLCKFWLKFAFFAKKNYTVKKKNYTTASRTGRDKYDVCSPGKNSTNVSAAIFHLWAVFWLKMIQTSCLTIASIFHFISLQKPCPSNQICDILVQNPSRSLTVETFDPEPNHPDNQWIKLPSHVHKIKFRFCPAITVRSVKILYFWKCPYYKTRRLVFLGPALLLGVSKKRVFTANLHFH